MKKILSIILCITLCITFCFSLSACGKIDYDIPKLEKLAMKQSADMVNGNFSSTVEKFSPMLTKKIDEKTLQEAFEATVKEVGDYVCLYNIDSEVVGRNLVITILEDYELSRIKVALTYDKNEELVGIFFSYVPYENDPVKNEKFEEMEVQIGDEYPLEGLLTIPTNSKNPPVVLMIQGSGSTDKNSTIYINKPFEDIAHGLAENGIATLRYDKRFFAYPEVAEKLGADLTLEDEVFQDVNFALDFLSLEDKVGDIYLLGHSMGGGLTPYIASENDCVKGIISVSGTLAPLYEVSYDQNKAIESEILKGNSDSETVALLKEQMKIVEKDIEVLRGDLENVPNDKILMGLYAGYQKSQKKYAGENYINKIDIPILVLQGGADFQVNAEKDYLMWKEMLNGRDKADFKLYEGLNHIMMPTNGKNDVSEYQTKSEVDKKVIEDIADFILK